MPSARAAEGTRVWWLLLAAALPVFFVALGANTIWEANEAFYVDTPKRMVESGDYVTPYFNGLPRLNKPVLSYWIVAGLYRAFGVSVTVERVGIAFGALGIVACAFLIGRAMRTTTTGVLAALVVASSPRVVMWSRRIFIDIYVTLFMSIALACCVMAERSPSHRRRWLLGMYVAIGLGVLTKGPVALFFPALVGALWLTFEKRWRDWSTFMIVPGVLIICALTLPWYAALYATHGWGPIVQFLVGENIERFATPETAQNRNLLFYLPVLLTDLFPWAPLLFLALVREWPRRLTGAEPPAGATRRLLWLWIVAIVTVFSFSQQKQDLYIFPIVAAAAVFVADALEDYLSGRRSRSVSRVLLGVSACCVFVAAGGYWLFSSGYFALNGIALGAGVLACGAIATGLAAWRARPVHAVAALALTFVTFNYVFVVRILPSLERLKPVATFAALMRAQGGERGNFGYYHFSLPSLPHYVGRRVEELGDVENARSFFLNDHGAWVVMNEESFRELRTAIPTICVLARHPAFQAKVADLVAHRAPADVLLVSNRGCESADAIR